MPNSSETQSTSPSHAEWTKPIYVRNRGDLIVFHFNKNGALSEIICYPSNSRQGISLEYSEVPEEIRVSYENQYLSRRLIRG